jgi:hypothetical protein
MSEQMRFDMSDVRVRWQLYRYHNRSHNGEIWLALQTDKGIVLMERTGERPHGSKLLGEIRTRIVEGEFVDDIIPLQQRSPAELARMHERAMQHRRYRAELCRRYSLAERIADLNGEKYSKPN